MKRHDIMKRFEDNISVNSDGCHIWTACRNRGGYGQLTARGKQWAAHRYAWTQANGPIPEGLHVLHHCDNPSCVNPSHLFIGTVADNIRDRQLKGRHRSGEGHGRAKLTVADVQKIRAMDLCHGKVISSVAKEYGVSRGTIYKIVNGTNWANLP